MSRSENSARKEKFVSMEVYADQWKSCADLMRAKAAEFDELAKRAPGRPSPVADSMKVAVCEYLLSVNKRMTGPFIPPTAIDWLGDGIVKAILESS